MIVHVFNASVVSGPETLVIPALKELGEKCAIVFLSETRLREKSARPPAYARSFGYDVHEIEVRARWDRLAVAELRALLARLEPRIVHAHEVKAAAYVAAASTRAGRRAYRLITTNHGVRAKKAPKLRAFEWLYTHLIMRKFDRVLSVCTSDRALLIARGVPSEKVKVHLNGVDRPKVEPAQRPGQSREIRERWGLGARGVGPDASVLGIVGRLAPEKRHSTILRSFRLLIDQGADAHLVVFGTGALEDALKTETEALGLGAHVHWLGYRAEVGSEMAGFDLLVSLSFAEGLPINVIEAGWAATPVIATAVDGNLDLISSSDEGILLPARATEKEISEALARALSDRPRLARLGERLQARVEREFSGRRWIETLRELYRF